MTGTESPDGGAETAPLVSVVTIFYNRADHVRSSIESLLSQTYPNMEIVAVDDGSTDDTLRELQAIEDPRYRVISKENTGFTRSLNFAIAQTSGAYVAIHDAGDISYP
ncbi:MAG: glycosyltransferase family A protein, partial [Pseudomonadota bacterium]